MEFILTILFVAGIMFVAKHYDSMEVKKRKRERESEVNRYRDRLLEESSKNKFRRRESPIEEALFSILENKPHLVTQCPVYSHAEDKTYRLDFAFPRFKVGIEADGFDFHQSRSEKLNDAKRDADLAKEGWVIYRYQGSLISKYPEYVRDEINRVLETYEI
tara:strand:+ start:289 stop:771 length:483 start_codon:yes stop_codon:yes gene_type:complete